MLLNSLWPDMLSGLVSTVGPQIAQEVLNAYLDARDVVPIPEWITGMKIVSFDLGKHCPFGIRAVHCATPGVAQNGDFVMDLEVEVLAADMDIRIHAQLNDGIAPLLKALNLFPEEESYIAIRVLDVRFVGTTRLRISPGARVACLGFTGVPSISLGLSVAYHSKLGGWERSVPVTALPGVSTFLEKLVQTEVLEYAAWPRFFAFDLVPPVLLSLPCAGERAPHSQLRVTLFEVRGLSQPTGDKAARPVVPHAQLTWGLEVNRHKCGPASKPLDEAGHASWADPSDPSAGASFLCDVFSPIGIEYVTITLHAPGYGPLGAAQVKLTALSSDETLFSFASAEQDAYSALPALLFGAHKQAFTQKYQHLLPGRVDAPGVTFGGAPGVMDAWVPLDNQPQAAVRLRLEMDWRYLGSAASSAGPLLGGFSKAVQSAQARAVGASQLIHVAFAEVRGLPPHGAYALAVGRPGHWRASQRTRDFGGASTQHLNDAVELVGEREAPEVTLLQLRGRMTPGPALEPLATVALPASQLSPGVAASMLLHLKPLSSLPRETGERLSNVHVLLRASLCLP